MQKVVLGFLAAALLAGSMSCKNAGFRKAKGGYWYKIVPGTSDTGAYAAKGKVLKFDITFKYNDSVLRTSVGQMPAYAPIDSGQVPEPYYTIFTKVRAGDSVVVKQLVDSMFKNRPFPPFAKKGNYITSNFKILGVFADKEVANADAQEVGKRLREQDSIKAIAQKETDDKAIQAYLTQHNIKAVKAPKGAYVEILEPGTGTVVDSSKTVGVNYSGRTMDDGKMFDSNLDSTFHHMGDTLKVQMNLGPMQGGMIEGFTDGISMLRQGAKARIYIPSAMGYGAYGRAPQIKPNANLIFDVDVVKVDNTPKVSAPMGGGPGRMTPEMEAKLRAAMQQQAAAQKAAQAQQPAPAHK